MKKILHQILFTGETATGRWVNSLIILLVVLSVAMIPLHFIPASDEIKSGLEVFDKIIITIFTIEFALRIYAAETSWRYIGSVSGLIDLAAILPFYLARMGWIPASPLFLGLRFFRILKLGKALEEERSAVVQADIEKHGKFHLIPGEQINKVIHKHPLMFLLDLLLPLFLTSVTLMILVFFPGNMIALGAAFLFFLLAFVFYLKAWIDHNYDVMYITNHRVIVQNRELFGVTANDVAHESINNVLPNTMGLFRWMFNYGDIQIETSSKAGSIRFTHCQDPHLVVKYVAASREREKGKK